MHTCKAAPFSGKHEAHQGGISIPISIFILLAIIQPLLIVVNRDHAVRQLPFLLPTRCEHAKLLLRKADQATDSSGAVLGQE